MTLITTTTKDGTKICINADKIAAIIETNGRTEVHVDGADKTIVLNDAFDKLRKLITEG